MYVTNVLSNVHMLTEVLVVSNVHMLTDVLMLTVAALMGVGCVFGVKLAEVSW